MLARVTFGVRLAQVGDGEAGVVLEGVEELRVKVQEPRGTRYQQT